MEKLASAKHYTGVSIKFACLYFLLRELEIPVFFSDGNVFCQRLPLLVLMDLLSDIFLTFIFQYAKCINEECDKFKMKQHGLV